MQNLNLSFVSLMRNSTRRNKRSEYRAVEQLETRTLLSAMALTSSAETSSDPVANSLTVAERPALVKIERFDPLEEQNDAEVLVFHATFDQRIDPTTVGIDDFFVSGGSTLPVLLAYEVVASDRIVFEIVLQGGDLATFHGTIGLNLSPNTDITDIDGNPVIIAEPPIDEVYTRAHTSNPNHAPSFVKGLSVAVPEDTGQVTINQWAKSISPGAGDVNQTVQFLISTNNNAIFSTLPAIDQNGTLTFFTAPNASGTAVVTVIAKDNGGTAGGGTDVSAPQTFNITVTSLNETGAPDLDEVGPTITLQKRASSVKVFPLITASGDSLGEGTLTVRLKTTAKASPLKLFTIPSSESLGVRHTSKFSNGHVSISIQLKSDVTTSAIQSFLRGIVVKKASKASGQCSVDLVLTDAIGRSDTVTQRIRLANR